MKLLLPKLFRPIFIGVTLCMPLASAGQNAPASPSSTTPQPAPATTLDTAKGLEGRLFFSALERQRMDEARKRGLTTGETGVLVEPSPSVLNGFVKRSDGNTAIWVDGDVRWNAKGKNADALLPSDVGGPAAYLKWTSGDSASLPSKQPARAKNAVKPRPRKITKPRLLP
jgi:hypothetical protein